LSPWLRHMARILAGVTRAGAASGAPTEHGFGSALGLRSWLDLWSSDAGGTPALLEETADVFAHLMFPIRPVVAALFAPIV